MKSIRLLAVSISFFLVSGLIVPGWADTTSSSSGSKEGSPSEDRNDNQEIRQNREMTAAFYRSLVEQEQPDIAKLNLFVTAMPKGGDLHHHYSGSIYAETYLEWVRKKGWLIDECTLKIVESISDTTCKPLTVDEVISAGPTYRKLLSLWSDKDFGNHIHRTPPPDEKFFNTFGFFGPIADDFVPIGLSILKKRALEENVSYIETMLSQVGVNSSKFFSDTDRGRINGNLTDARSQAEVDRVLDQVVEKYVQSKEFNTRINQFVSIVHSNHEGIDDDFFMMRYQTYAVRVLDPLSVFTDLLSGYLAADRSALIVGVNIVAPENNYIALRDYTLHMQMYNYLLRKYPSVNRALHAGELTLGMVRPINLNFHIREALEIARAQRVGHGVDLPYEEDSIDLLAKLKADAVIEINLTSNQFILGVEGNAHPYLIYSSYGVPLVISTDDSGVSRNNLSNEYMLLASRYRPAYETIKEYVYNSIEYAFLREDDKKVKRAQLDREFEQFEQEMSRLYSALKSVD